MTSEIEKTVKEWLYIQKKYARKRPFSTEKLKTEDFSQKYWLDGEDPYQYHTMDIEDGRDEREQLVINNVRSLKNRIVDVRKRTAESLKEIRDENKKEIARIKVITIVTCVVQFGILAVISIQHIQRYLKKAKNRK